MMRSFNGFASGFFAGNRARLKAEFTDGPIIVAGNGLFQKTRDDDAFPFKQSANFWYLTGIEMPDMIMVINGSEEYLILPKRDNRFEVFSGKFDSKKLVNISGIAAIYPYSEGKLKLAETIKKSKQAGVFKPGPEYDRIYNVYTNPSSRRLAKKIKTINNKINLVDIRPLLSQMRCIKSKDEIDALKFAIDHTTEACTLISKNYSKFKNEREIEAELIYHAAKHGLGQAFSPIIANGKNACTLHYQANDDLIDKSKPTLFDIGFSANGYCADITRVICPRPTKRQEAVYQAVLDIQKYAIELLEPGVMPQEYERQVTKFAGEKLLGLGLIKEIEARAVHKYFPHRTSHFLGIDVHDVGDYSKPLQPGMVLTVEPGIYIEKESIGVRIEDDVVITKKGNEVLSKNLSRQISSITIKQL